MNDKRSTESSASTVVAYLDTHEYVELLKDHDKRACVLRAIGDGRLQLVTSIFPLEEMLLLADGDADAFWRLADSWQELSNEEHLVLPSPELLDVDVEAALCRRRPSLIELQHHLTPRGCVERIREESKGAFPSAELIEVIQLTRAKRDTFQSGMQEARRRAIDGKKSWPLKWRPSLDEFCMRGEREEARSLIQPLGYKWELTDDGIDEMLSARSLKLAVRGNLALAHRQVFGGFEPKLSDGTDIHHAIASSTADYFVTDDKALRGGIEGIGIEGYDVLTLSRFLAKLACD